jgi:hypothetical protein
MSCPQVNLRKRIPEQGDSSNDDAHAPLAPSAAHEDGAAGEA